MKKEDRKKQKREYKKNIPDEIKILYGRFTIYSLLMTLFFGFLFPFLLLGRISKVSSLLLFLILVLFYLFILIDVVRKRKTYHSSIFYILILLFFSTVFYSALKFFTLS